MGRVTLMTPRKMRRFYRALLDGNTITVACAVAGFSLGTFSRWQKVGMIHNNECELDLDTCAIECRSKTVLYASVENDELPAKRRLFLNVRKAIALAEKSIVTDIKGNVKRDWKAGAFLLQARNRKDWKPENKLEVKHSGSVTHKAKLELAPDQLDKMARLMQEQAKQLRDGVPLLESGEDTEAIEGEIIEDTLE